MDVTGSTPGSVLFTTYNVLDLGAGDSAAGAEHYKTVVESIQALRTDVLAVQEIRGPDGGTATFEIDPFRKHCLLNGLDDIGLTMEKKPAIDAYEQKAKRERAWA